MLSADKTIKNKLRKIKLVSPVTDEVRTILKSGIVGSGISGAYIQFGADVQMYNLWEALLYAEGYEPEYYKPGTAQRALDAAVLLLKD